MGGRAGEDGKNWLLIKHDDKYAKLSKDFVLVDKKPKSVLSKRTMEQIASARDQVWSSGNGAKRVRTTKTAKTQAAGKAVKRKRATAGSAVKKKRAVKKK
jgi:bifunctional non-homologous end joining protein LigD